MRRELEEKLREAHPGFFRDLYGPPARTCLSAGIECGDGWFDLLGVLCDQLAQVTPEGFCFDQIKEKFGTLCVHGSHLDDEDGEEVAEIIGAAEAASLHICEACGATDGVTLGGTPRLRTLCGDCRR